MDTPNDPKTSDTAGAGGAKPWPVDPEALKEHVRAIVADGDQVRERVGGLVAEAIRQAQESGQGVLQLMKSVFDGAAEAASRAVNQKPDGTLKQVTEAIGDGLSQAALSAKLAMEEARARGQKFKGEDLKQVGDNFDALRSLFIQSVADGGKAFQSFMTGQVGDITEHAERVFERVKPSVESAVKAAREHPIELGQESLAASAAVTREAAGSLFTAMGRLLQQAGEAIKPEPKTGVPKPPADTPPAAPPTD